MAHETMTRNTQTQGLLGATDVALNIAVKDLAVAKRFYEGTLGLKPAGGEGDELLAYRSGNATLFVYHSEFAGTNNATAATWMVGSDIERIVGALKDKGVEFEHYQMPGMTLKGDIHQSHAMKIAWFKDPDGNILSLSGE